MSEGSLGFLEAVRRFDPCKRARLTTYAVYWMRKRLRGYVDSEDEQNRCFSIYEELPSSKSSEEAEESRWVDTLSDGFCEDDLIRGIDLALLRNVVISAIATLSPRQRAVVRLLFWEDRPKSEIAAELGISPARVSKLLKLSYIKLAERFSDFREVVFH